MATFSVIFLGRIARQCFHLQNILLFFKTRGEICKLPVSLYQKQEVAGYEPRFPEELASGK